MNILVTGGAGFIGSHLCEKLAQGKDTVFSLDNYSTGSIENHVENVTYIKGSTTDIDSISFIPEIIYHLGEYSRVEQSFEDIEKVFKSNKEGFFLYYNFAERLKQSWFMPVVVLSLEMEGQGEIKVHMLGLKPQILNW